LLKFLNGGFAVDFRRDSGNPRGIESRGHGLEGTELRSEMARDPTEK